MHFPIVIATLSSLPSLLASPAPLKWFGGANLPARSTTYSPSHAPYNATPPYCPPRFATEAQQRTIFSSFITTLYTEKNVTGAFSTFIDPNLIEHDPFDPQGAAANAAKLSNIIPFVPSTVLRSAFSDNVGLIHVRVDEEGHRPIALADIYRMNGTCIVEHWDVTQETPANATNPIAMF